MDAQYVDQLHKFHLTIHIVRAAVILVVGLPVVLVLSRSLGRYMTRRHSAHVGMIFRKFTLYLGLMIVGVSVFLALEFNLSALLGTAGIASLAIGFAAKTGLSNLISGLFILGEKPFEVGDLVQIGDTVGYVLSIDLLSVKIRTPSNLFVRIPNESLVQSDFINITRFPIRRLDLNVGLPYDHDLRKMMEILLDVARQNPCCLDEPEPTIQLQDFGNSSIDLKLCVWFEKSRNVEIKNTLMLDLKERFDRENIGIPFPQVCLSVAEGAVFPFSDTKTNV